MTLYPLLAVLYFTTIFFGAVHIWAYSLVELFILAGTLFFLGFTCQRTFKQKESLKLDYKDPIVLIAFLFFAYILFQITPLPPALIKWLSPQAWEIWNRAPLPSDSWFPLSIHPYATKQSLIFAFALFLIYFWVAQGITSKKQIMILIWGLILLGTADGLYGLLERVRPDPHILWWGKTFGKDIVSGTFINRNHFAAFLSMTICLNFSFLWGRMNRISFPPNKDSRTGIFQEWRINLHAIGLTEVLLVLSLLVQSVALLLSASRGGLLSTLITLSAMISYITIIRFKASVKILFLVVSILILAYGSYLGAEKVWSRFENLEMAKDARVQLFMETGEVQRDFPLFGSGLGTFEEIIPAYQPTSPILYDHAHNDWLELLTDTGWIGLGLFCLGFIWVFIQSIRTLFFIKDPFIQGGVLGGTGALLSIALCTLTEFSLHTPAVPILATTILGINRSLIVWGRRDSGTLKNISPRRDARGKIHLWFFFLLCSFFSFLSGEEILKLFLANRYLPLEVNSVNKRPDPKVQDILQAILYKPDYYRSWAALAEKMKNEEFSFLDLNFHLLQKKRRTQDLKSADLAYKYPLIVYREILTRNPSSSRFWLFLSQAYIKNMSHDPLFFKPLSQQALDNAVFLGRKKADSYCSRGYFSLTGEGNEISAQPVWVEDFKRCLIRGHWFFTPLVVENMHKIRGEEALRWLPEILPPRSLAWIRAGQYLLDQGLIELGEPIFLKGEEIKGEETKKLEEKIRKKRGVNEEKEIQELLEKDPENPIGLYYKGDLLRSLMSAWKRGLPLANIDQLETLESGLNEKDSDSMKTKVQIVFLTGVIKVEKGDKDNARILFQKSLSTNPNFFPALIELERLLEKMPRTEVEEITLNSIQGKIALFDMNEIPPGAWVKGKPDEFGQPTYHALLRHKKKLESITYSLPETGKRWSFFVDGRFWAAAEDPGGIISTPREVSWPAGEHEVQLRMNVPHSFQEKPVLIRR
ncbi:MAG: O-antigen ligase family protein [Thermodesulfobacteriota bacterium]